MKSSEVKFNITAEIEGQEKQVNVTQLETTDGVPYYACHTEKGEITQLRNETYGKWEQLWGNLDDKTIQYLGKQIEKQITPP